MSEPIEGLTCFLDSGRICGPDCMAYQQPPSGAEYQDQQFAQCMLLVNAHRTAKHLVILASEVRAISDNLTATPPPPPPRTF